MKKGIAVVIMSCLVLAGCGGSSKESASDDLALESNQSIKYGQVTKINGNELTIAWANEVSSSDMSSMKGGKRQNSTSDANASDNPNAAGNSDSKSQNAAGGNRQGESSPSGNTSGGNTSGGNAPSQDMGGGNAPSQDMGGGNPPSGDMGGGTPPDMNGGNAQSSVGSSDRSSSNKGSIDGSSSNKGKLDKSSSKQQNRTMYQLTGEEDTITIPVGTKVTTSLGATTTFSRIAANDTLKLLMQTNDAGEQVVVGVWIVA